MDGTITGQAHLYGGMMAAEPFPNNVTDPFGFMRSSPRVCHRRLFLPERGPAASSSDAPPCRHAAKTERVSLILPCRRPTNLPR